MSLDLDPRQHAMLQEMGVRVWQPLFQGVPRSTVPAEAAPTEPGNATKNIANHAEITGATTEKYPVKSGKAPLVRPPAPAPSPDSARVAAVRAGHDDSDWSSLAQDVAGCQACALCEGRRAPVLETIADSSTADWLVLGEPPDDAEERAGAPFADQSGQLLGNMLKALGLNRGVTEGDASTMAYVTNVVKCRPATARNPTLDELATCEQYLRREVALVQPRIILAMGRFAAQALLQQSVPEVAQRPLGQLRGQLYRYQGIPVVVTYPTSHLLRNPQAKARAWEDLCLALEAARQGH